ncbi:MAG: AraC family transcriptional regulator ligand-binding domain-containing protein [Sphingorhabdus sp.]
MLNRILRAAEQLGASRHELVGKIGLDEGRLLNPLGRMSFLVLFRLFKQLERDFDDPAIAIRLARVTGPRNFSDPGFATRLAGNLAETLQANVDMQAMRQSVFESQFSAVDDMPTLAWTIAGHDDALVAPFVEYSMAVYLQLSHDVLFEPMQIRCLAFQHQARFPIEQYAALFGHDVEFGAEQTTVGLSKSQLYHPIPAANRELQLAAMQRYRKAAEYMHSGKKLAGRSFLYLWIEMDKSPLTLSRMASAFGITERSARRKLVGEGHPFRSLLDEVRRDLWELYRMEGRRSLTEIAELLGYSTLSAFTRSHSRWYGVPPSGFDG